MERIELARGEGRESIEARRACNHADGSANISTSLLGRVLFSLHREKGGGRERVREGERSPCGDRSAAHTAVTYVVHFVFKQCGNRRERGNVYRRNGLDDSGSQRRTFFFRRPRS